MQIVRHADDVYLFGMKDRFSFNVVTLTQSPFDETVKNILKMMCNQVKQKRVPQVKACGTLFIILGSLVECDGYIYFFGAAQYL